MTGYEAAKATGISRSNAYTSLAGLVDKGAACTVDGTPTKYVPVPAEEFLEKKIGSLKQLKNELIASLPDKSDREEAYITIKGEENICHKIESLIKSALQRVYISGEMPSDFAFCGNTEEIGRRKVLRWSSSPTCRWRIRRSSAICRRGLPDRLV